MNYKRILEKVNCSTLTNCNVAGSWENELGSVARFIQEDNVLSGTYYSSVSEGSDAATGTIQGYVNGNVISFVVTWTNFAAITAWVGTCTDSAQITTLWQMVSVTDSADEWQSINAGADTFTPVLTNSA